MLFGRLQHGKDLVRELNRFVASEGIKAGVVQVIGSLTRARLSFFDQKMHAYRELDFDAPHEIVSCTGNISLRDDKPYAHIHLAVADSHGNVHGGHCLEGCRIFAIEFVIWPFQGETPRRSADQTTGLLLWEKPVYRENGS
jgi:uncharacterized protein